MLDLQKGATDYDAVWPASTIWLDLGDTQGVVSRTQSIMTTPVVFGVKRSVAEELGWIGADVSVDDILAASESGQLDFIMSSASQSNSGAMAYLGYLYAFAGHPEVLTSEMLRDPEIADNVKRILGSVDRTAGSSGFLRDLMVENYADYDGMVNNESAIITANQQLPNKGETDLLYVIYPVDGLAIADWPLGFVDHDVEGRSELFDRLQEYLLSDEIQQELLAQGRRTSGFGATLDPALVDPAVFNPDWGIDVARPLDPITLPASDVILEALGLYQTAFRKPSFVVFCLDFSGSMARRRRARAHRRDEYAARSAASIGVLPAADRTRRHHRPAIQWRRRTAAHGRGERPGRIAMADEDRCRMKSPGGGTNIYGCLSQALTFFDDVSEEYAPAIILMTDGQSNEGSFADFAANLPADPDRVVPVYSILFGDASRDQLEQIADATRGAIYDGRDGLVKAMRDAFANA